MTDETPATPVKRKRRVKKLLFIVLALLLAYGAVAYLVAPRAWTRYFSRHPALEDEPGITYAGDGIPGDPINVELVGTKQQLMKIMVAAKWYPADPLSFRSCLEIADATVLKRPYDSAPVSSLYLFKRKEDLAFEQPVGPDPRRRHHVRFWLTDKVEDGREVWIGSAVFDQHVGFSETTGQITHVTAPDVDKERDYLFDELEKTGHLSQRLVIPDFHEVREGRNGGGDPWHTDGDLYAGIIDQGF